MAEIRTETPPSNHNEDLKTQTGCYGNLGHEDITPKTAGCVSPRRRGDRRAVVPSPPQDWKAAEWRITRQPMWVEIFSR
ncbi:hypothetical protein INR49_028215 [Caranx melampygus]|nr:hypothetical protein INR49_028215 [Caranx melampygus]